MPMPRDVPIIDTMLGIPRKDQTRVYDFMRPLFQDGASKTEFAFPAEYMFKEYPKVLPQEDFVAYTLALMDAFGIRVAMLGYDESSPDVVRALREHPDRFVAELHVDPNQGMDEVRRLVRIHREVGLRAVGAFAAGTVPQAPIGDKRWYPLYAKCIELGLPVFTCVGVPGPRVPMEPQRAMDLDEVAWFFPELTLVIRHGAEPWVDLAVKLLLKYPNLYYSTTAFAPKHYPSAIIDFANTRGADKVMYGGYFPAGLTLERIFHDMPGVPLRDEVWPKFLYANAARVLGIELG
jgi:predicted TIM-barrel fold metal-dependent hydrolase